MLVKIERGILCLLGAAMFICVIGALIESRWHEALNLSGWFGLVIALLLLSGMREQNRIAKHLFKLNQTLEEKNRLLEETLAKLIEQKD